MADRSSGQHGEEYGNWRRPTILMSGDRKYFDELQRHQLRIRHQLVMVVTVRARGVGQARRGDAERARALRYHRSSGAPPIHFSPETPGKNGSAE
jgi:hypothetical protein